MSEDTVPPVMFNIDGYNVEVTISNLSFFDDPIPTEDDMTDVGTVEYEFNILYDFEDQEAYDAVHRMVDNKIPTYLNEWIRHAITAMIDAETSTETST